MDINLVPQYRVKIWQWGVCGCLLAFFCLSILFFFSKKTITQTAIPPQKPGALKTVIDPSKLRLATYALRSLRLVGSIQQGARSWGLIRSPNGTIATIQMGDYLGKGCAKVVSISADLMRVEEPLPDGVNAKTRISTIHLVNANHTKRALNDHQSISLNVEDIPVRTVLQLLADFADKNMIISDAVTGNISLHLHELSWKNTLDVILRLQGLEQQLQGQVFLIDKLNTSNSYQKETSSEKDATQKLNLTQTILIQINYAKAVDIANLIRDKSSSILSEQGLVGADARTNTLWLQDTPKNLHRIKLLIQRLDVPIQQVLIEARIVNMSKDCSRDLGVRFGITKATQLSGSIDSVNQLRKGIPLADVSIPERLNFDLSAIPLDASPASIGIALAKLGNNQLLDLELSALESEGRAEIIANPRLMTTNQHAAVIESGEDIPYQETSLNGATTISFKKAVLSLKVTPQITPNGKLLMDLLINQDSDSGRRVQGVPILLTKSIATHVLVNHGETIVLGGIYKKDKNNAVVRVPILGQLPIFGYLFSRKQAKIRNEELLIFITPRIIMKKILKNAKEKSDD